MHVSDKCTKIEEYILSGIIKLTLSVLGVFVRIQDFSYSATLLQYLTRSFGDATHVFSNKSLCDQQDQSTHDIKCIISPILGSRITCDDFVNDRTLAKVKMLARMFLEAIKLSSHHAEPFHSIVPCAHSSVKGVVRQRFGIALRSRKLFHSALWYYSPVDFRVTFSSILSLCIIELVIAMYSQFIFNSLQRLS